MLFVCKYPNGKYVFKSASFFYDSNGNRQYKPGTSIKFENGYFETNDKELIEQIKASPYFGVEIWAEGKSEASEEGKLIQQREDEAKEKLLTSCPKCPFKAETEADLKAHMKKKHDDK